MIEDNTSIDIVRSYGGGNGEPVGNESAAIEYRPSPPRRQRTALPAGVKKAAAIALLAAPLGSASFAGLPAEGASGTGDSAPISISAEAYSARATGRARLARLKAERFATVSRETRIKRALQALATMPDTIRLNDEDARWIAENPDIEDL